MKVIKIAKEIKLMLDDHGDGLSIDKTLQGLLEDVDLDDEPNESLGFINITINDDTHDKLTRCKVYPNEPFASVIYRLMTNY